MIKMTYNGKPFDAADLIGELESKAIEMAMRALEEKARGAAGTVVDPETGRHADVFVDRLPGNRVAVRTTGSPAFARIIEQRLGVGAGEVEVVEEIEAAEHPRVYLAHASEDKADVRPIAEYLMGHGVDVWFDEWEINPGDSLRQKMEEGLLGMTHFAVVLTPTSIKKPWVQREIDAGLVGLVGGRSKMVPLRLGTAVSELSPFLQTLLCPEIDPTDEQSLAALVDRLHGVSRKPALGPKPSYVQSVPPALGGWSPAAVAVARFLVEASDNAMTRDPIKTLDEIVAGTDLSPEDVRIAVLDLKEAGLLWEGSIPGHFAPEGAMFVEFDEHFMPFKPSEDARTVANRMVSEKARVLDTQTLAQELDWSPRRMNSAISYLIRAGAIETRHALASAPWRAVGLVSTDRTLRFARSHA